MPPFEPGGRTGAHRRAANATKVTWRDGFVVTRVSIRRVWGAERGGIRPVSALRSHSFSGVAGCFSRAPRIDWYARSGERTRALLFSSSRPSVPTGVICSNAGVWGTNVAVMRYHDGGTGGVCPRHSTKGAPGNFHEIAFHDHS